MYRLITCTWGWRFEACAAGWKPGRESQQSFDSTYLAPSEGSFDGTRNSSWQTPFSHFPPHWWMHLVSKHSQSTVAKATSKFQSHKVPHLLRLFISIHANQLSRAKCFKPHRLRIWTIRVWWLCWFSVPYLCVLEFSAVLLYFDKVPFPLQCRFSSFFLRSLHRCDAGLASEAWSRRGILGPQITSKHHFKTIYHVYILYSYHNELEIQTAALAFFIFDSSLLGKSIGGTNRLPWSKCVYGL